MKAFTHTILPLALVFASCAATQVAMADNLGWQGGPAGDWFNANNWIDYTTNINMVPGPSDYVYIDNGWPTIDSGSATAFYLDIGGSVYTLGFGSIEQDDGTLSLTYDGTLIVDENGLYNQLGGVVNTGTIDVVGGESCQYQLQGGVISAGTEDIGISDYDGTGAFLHSGGTNMYTYLILGEYPGFSGVYLLSAGTLNGGEVDIGYNGIGNFTQTGGGNYGLSLQLGENAGSSGAYSLSGGTLGVEYVAIGYSGSGNFTQTGGTHNDLALVLGSGAGSSGTYTLSGGTLSVNANDGEVGELIGDFGIGNFTQTGGANSITNSGLTLATQVGSSGTYTLSGGTLSAGFEEIGLWGGPGTFTQTGGANTLNYFYSYYEGGYYYVGNYLILGVVSSGAYTLSDGALSAAYEYVGEWGMGVFAQSGGTNSLSEALELGYYAGATGTVWVTGGQLNVANGSIIVGNQGLGQMTVSGGTVTVGSLIVNNNINGPTINTNRFTLSGGVVNSAGTTIANGLTFADGDGVDAATYHLLGGVHSFANGLEVRNNGTLSGCGTINGFITVDPGGAVVADCGGTLYLSGLVTNSGSIIATNGTTIDFYGPVVGTGTITHTDGNVQFFFPTITTSTSPISGGSASGGGVYSLGADVTVCASPSPCYSFVNWTDQNSNVVSTSACYLFTAVSNETLIANFASPSYTITTSSSPSAGGSTTGGGTYCGSNVTVCATANSCYSFVNWTLNGNLVSTSACYSFTAASNATLVANFTPILYTTITTTNVLTGAGSTSGGGTVACGSEVTVCATPNPCYNFTSWSLLGGRVVSTSACYTFTATNSETLVANFEAGSTYDTITTSSSPLGGGTTSGGGGTVTCGSLATVCASANSCYSFANWTLNGNLVSTSACYSFTATTNETVVANFAVNSAPTSGSLTSLWSFTGANDGANPYAGLVHGSDGNFYGTTYDGGTGGNGTVFRIGPNGNLTNLWSFSGGTDGANPGAGLAQGSDGSFYGTTYGSGSGPSGNGTVFRITSGGSLTTLWPFTGGTDGANPYAPLVQGSDGNLYGTTSGSGSGPSAYGTVFRITTGGSLSNLHSFVGSDGVNPSAGLVQGSDGNFYGTTYSGGAYGYGTVFRIASNGNLTTLWSFTNGLDGASSYATLVVGSDGNFYGTTSAGGASGYGTVFRITSSGSLSNLWGFTGCSDGAYPVAGLVQGSDGNFYGTTSGSGSGPSAYGTVFQITPGGNLTTLWLFTNGVDGASSYGALVQGSDGSFYGTTVGSGSGTSPNGTVFKLSIPLNPPANQISGIKLMGASLVVSIPSVAGETYQLQYSGSLSLSNWSNVGGVSMTNSIGGMLSLTNLGGAMQPQGFYRFAITP